MAIHFHGGVPLLWQARACSFQSASLPATAPLRGAATSCVSPLVKLCSPLNRVRCAAVSKGSEVHSVEIPAKYDETEPPPLVASLAVPGLPPYQENVHTDEAIKACLRERFPSNWSEFGPMFYEFISFVTFCYPAAVSADRLAVISVLCAHAIMLEDVLIDSPNPIRAEKMGIDPNIPGNPHRLREYFHSLYVLLRQEEPPPHPTPIQELTWKLGHDFRELSTPEWFNVFSDSFLAFFLACLDSHKATLEGYHRRITDVESFTQIRMQSFGGDWDNLSVEFCNNVFLPTEIRQHPAVQQLSMAKWIWGSRINDIFSYSKEQDELYAPNLIKWLMEVEGLTVAQAAWRSVKLTNSKAQEIMELETQLLAWEEGPGTAALRRYVEGIKESMSGNIYWHSSTKRYKHPEAPFPEMRVGND